MKASKLGDDLWYLDDESEVVVQVNGRYFVVGEVVDKGDCIVELVLTDRTLEDVQESRARLRAEAVEFEKTLPKKGSDS